MLRRFKEIMMFIMSFSACVFIAGLLASYLAVDYALSLAVIALLIATVAYLHTLRW